MKWAYVHTPSQNLFGSVCLTTGEQPRYTPLQGFSLPGRIGFSNLIATEMLVWKKMERS
jgi:hypothetical protein